MICHPSQLIICVECNLEYPEVILIASTVSLVLTLAKYEFSTLLKLQLVLLDQ